MRSSSPNSQLTHLSVFLSDLAGRDPRLWRPTCKLYSSSVPSVRPLPTSRNTHTVVCSQGGPPSSWQRRKGPRTSGPEGILSLGSALCSWASPTPALPGLWELLEGLAEAFSPPVLRIGQRSVSAKCMWEWKPESDEGRRGPEAYDHATLHSRQQRRPR